MKYDTKAAVKAERIAIIPAYLLFSADLLIFFVSPYRQISKLVKNDNDQHQTSFQLPSLL
jgi:hypothetical protein